MKVKDIKLKEKTNKIKEKNSEANINHFIKNNQIKMKGSIDKNKTDSNQNNRKATDSQKEDTKTENYAINHVENIESFAAVEGIYRTHKNINKRQKNIKEDKKINKIHDKDVIFNETSLKSDSIKNKSNQNNNVGFDHNVVKFDSLEHSRIKLKKYNGLYAKQKKLDLNMKRKNRMRYKDNSSTNYSNIKSLMIRRYKINKENTKQGIKNTKNATNTFSKGIKATYNSVKKTFHGVKKFYSYGIGLIILLIVCLFIGVFAALDDKSINNSEIMPLDPNVIEYKEEVIKYAKKYDVLEYVDVIMAIMQQESGGKGNDPMQSSECQFNTRYPHKPNAIQDPIYSIEVGIQYFANCKNEAKVKDVSDTNNLYLALQGYNYGNGYIKWAIKNFDGYSKANAKLFSDNMKNKLKKDVYGDPFYVEHVIRYIGFDFRGNINPNFSNKDAWINKNPYAQAKLYGQCTWFAWGRFYELYGYSPGFIGNGWDCVDQLLKTHPNKFEHSNIPKAGAVFSGVGKNHVGIVLTVDGNNLTIQEGNLDGKTNTFEDAKTDWHTKTVTIDELRAINKGLVFANPK